MDAVHEYQFQHNLNLCCSFCVVRINEGRVVISLPANHNPHRTARPHTPSFFYYPAIGWDDQKTANRYIDSTTGSSDGKRYGNVLPPKG